MICGTVVKSISGRDQDRFYAVVSVEENFAWIVDGKVRKLASPKKKNKKHLRETNHCIGLDQITSDKSLKKALAMLDLID